MFKKTFDQVPGMRTLVHGCQAIQTLVRDFRYVWTYSVFPKVNVGIGSTYKVIPLAFNEIASACVAREQCVFTLPSEQPMACAVSATSISSQ